MKSTFDAHTNRIYFFLANKYNHEVILQDFAIPDHIDLARCNVFESFFCGDVKYESHELTMSSVERSGEVLDILEYAPYEIFE